MQRVSLGRDAELRIVRPAKRSSTGPVPALLHIHGGGMVLRMPESFLLANARAIIAHARARGLGDVVVCASTYRLAPADPFPAGVDDNAAALQYMRKNAAELGIDAARIVVGGESAGGHFTMAVVLRDIDQNHNGFPPVSAIVPVIAPFDMSPGWNATGSFFNFVDFGFNPELMDDILRIYCVAPCDASSKLVSPLRASNAELAKLPPTFIRSHSRDPFSDSSEMFANRLRAVGVHVQHDRCFGCLHSTFTTGSFLMDIYADAFAHVQ